MNARKALKLIFGIGLASFFLWLVVRQISPAELRQSFASADPGWITLALLAFLAGYACRIERWRLMLVRSNPELGWRHCAGPLLASVAANNVLPFRAGDLIRAFGFNRRLKISANTAIITLFAERLLDLLMVLLFLGLALGHFGADINRLAGIGGLAPMAAAALILYPFYVHPLSGLPCRVEELVEEIARKRQVKVSAIRRLMLAVSQSINRSAVKMRDRRA